MFGVTLGSFQLLLTGLPGGWHDPGALPLR
jgi:hypothetical protein